VRSTIAALAAASLIVGACATGAGVPAPGSPATVSAPAVSSAPTAGPTASPSPSAPPAAAIGDKILVAGKQYLTVVRAEQWRGRQPSRGSHFVAVLVELEGVADAPYKASLFTVDSGGDVNGIASAGRRPRFGSGRELAPGRTYRGWVTFSVPLDCRCVLRYALPTGQGGQRSEAARVLLDPIGEPTVDPSPTPVPPPELAGLGREFFGPDVTVTTYDVRGRTRLQIARSIEASGPRLAWLDGAAAAVTQTEASFNFDLRESSSGCRIVTGNRPAIELDYSVVLPKWDPPANAPNATVEWWNDEFRDIAVHERTHVEIYRDGLDELNEVVESSTCENLEARLERAWAPINREQCEFDMREYGAALGLSIERCLQP
jgi:predicted secreted Zn-dependent protease